MLRPLVFRKKHKKKACNRLDYRLFRWRRVRDSNPWSGMSRTTDFESCAEKALAEQGGSELVSLSPIFRRYQAVFEEPKPEKWR